MSSTETSPMKSTTDGRLEGQFVELAGGTPSPKFLSALATVQRALKPALKDSQNPHFRSSYPSLESVWEACHEALAAGGFFWTASTIFKGEESFLQSSLWHAETGEELSIVLPLLNPQKTMQGLGSAMTYARRYGLMALVGICPEDDDGAVAGGAGQGDSKQRGAQGKGDAESGGFRRDGKAVNSANADWQKKPASPKQIGTLKAQWQTLEKQQMAPGEWKDFLQKNFNKTSAKDLTGGEASQLIAAFSDMLRG